MNSNLLMFPYSPQPKRKPAAPRKRPATGSPLESVLMKAVKELVLEKGFDAITESAVIKRAGVTRKDYRAVFKNREALLKRFTEMHDYWLSNLKKGLTGTLGFEAFLEQTLINLMYSLYEDPIMQRMLVWGLDSDNAVTRHIAALRDSANRELIQYLEAHAAKSGVDIPVHGALLIGGIYYVVLQSSRATACNVDFTTAKGKKRLANAISFAVVEIFAKHMFPNGNGRPILRLVENNSKD